MGNTLKVHQAIAQVLRDQGIKCFFGLLGDGNLFFADAFVRQYSARYVAAATESSSVLMASAYAHVAGDVGVATVTCGPALTNTVTALAECVRNRSKVLLIAGDTGSEDIENLQRIDQREVVKAAGAGFVQARSPETVATDLLEALRRVRAECRPVVFNIPIDFQWCDVDEPAACSRVGNSGNERPSPDPDALDAAVGILASSLRPVILAGEGAIDDDARAALIALSTRIGAPLATTLKARELFAGEPHDIGICGTFASNLATEIIMASDAIFVFGASLNRYTTLDGTLFNGKAIVQCDSNRTAIGARYRTVTGIVGDAARTARAMIDMLDEAEVAPTEFATRVEQAALVEPLPVDQAELDLRHVATWIDETLPADRVYVTDCGRFMLHTLQRIRAPHPRHFLFTVNFGSIGFGLPNAIGAAIAAPDRPVLLVCGDGGFAAGGLMEFHTAVEHGLDLVVIVCNDGSYGAEYVQFTNRGLDPGMSLLGNMDLARVAEALGGEGVTVRNYSDLDAARARIEQRHGPILVDVKLDPATVPSMSY